MNNKIFHSKTTDFFVEEDFQPYEQQARDGPVTELNLTCWGYGLFTKYVQSTKKKFLDYLKRALREERKSLRIIKIVYNGFDINDAIFEEICNEIILLFEYDQNKIKSISIETTNLRKCSLANIEKVMKIGQRAISSAEIDDVTLQLSGWQFEANYPSLNQLLQAMKNLEPMQGSSCYIKRFKLEISNWYATTKSGYLGLKDIMAEEEVINQIQREQNISANVEERFRKALKELIKLAETKEDKPEDEEVLENITLKQKELAEYGLKFAMDSILDTKIRAFRDKITPLIASFHEGFVTLNEFHLDFRGWSSILKMSELKQYLDTKKFTLRNEFSIITKLTNFDRMGEEIDKSDKQKKKQLPPLKSIYVM